MLVGITLYGVENMNLHEWQLKNNTSRKYAHFDRRVLLSNVWRYISDPGKVKTHSFFPFIHYTQVLKKYNKEQGVKLKKRELYYSSHIDRYIYSYYGYLLNQQYDIKAKADGIDSCAIAYRDNKSKCNIHFAKQAIDYVRNLENCYIIIGDFTNFFDSLDHDYLKQMICKLLNTAQLPDDYFAVYKSITKYAKWEMESLLLLNDLPVNGIKELNSKEQVLSMVSFHEMKKKTWKKTDSEGNETEEKYITKNQNDYGIPQGSAISAVLSNIYMLEFDKKLNDYVKGNGGLYLRYSDDFIIIFPKVNDAHFIEQFEKIMEVISSTPRINLQPDKTQIFQFDSSVLSSCNQLVLPGVENQKDLLNYLGFTFDGKVVTIRDKTLSKYYYRMYGKLKTIVKNEGKTKNGKRISCKNLYATYTSKGAKKGNGNFLTYVAKAKSIWGPQEAIERGTKKHMQKIRKKLNTIV